MIINWQPLRRMSLYCLQRQRNSNLTSTSSTFPGRSSCPPGSNWCRRIATSLFRTNLSISSKCRLESTNHWKPGRDPSSLFSLWSSSRSYWVICWKPPWSTTRRGSLSWLLRRWRNKTNRGMVKKPVATSPRTARKRPIWTSRTLIAFSSTCSKKRERISSRSLLSKEKTRRQWSPKRPMTFLIIPSYTFSIRKKRL